MFIANLKRFPVVQFLIHNWASSLHGFEGGPPSHLHISGESERFYDDIMTRISQQANPDATLALNVLTWVTFSKRPVTVGEITDVIGGEALTSIKVQRVNVDSELLTAVCAGLLTIESQTGYLSLVHMTLRDYLQGNRHGILPRPHQYITLSCLEYLSRKEFSLGPCKSISQCRS